MKAIFLAGLSGFFKGAMYGRPDVRSPGFGNLVTAAAREELTYRALPATVATALGKTTPRGLSAFIFAVDHLRDDAARGVSHSLGGSLGRFADVFLGGLLYEDAYRSHGLLGAVAAHAAHNLAVYAGTAATRQTRGRVKLGNRTEFGRCRPMRRRR